MLNLYIDSADRAEAEPLLQQGIFAGLTTNPTLLQRAGVTESGLSDVVAWACDAGAKSVFLQAWGSSVPEMVDRGLQLHSFGGQVVVKVPVTQVGIEAATALTRAGVPVLVTAVYAASQIVPALATGAAYVAPYLGRMDDAGMDGVAEIRTMQRVIDATSASTRVLAASVRTPEKVIGLLEAAVQDITISASAWASFFRNELTDAAVAAFESAADSL